MDDGWHNLTHLCHDIGICSNDNIFSNLNTPAKSNMLDVQSQIKMETFTLKISIEPKWTIPESRLYLIFTVGRTTFWCFPFSLTRHYHKQFLLIGSHGIYVQILASETGISGVLEMILTEDTLACWYAEKVFCPRNLKIIYTFSFVQCTQLKNNFVITMYLLQDDVGSNDGRSNDEYFIWRCR